MPESLHRHGQVRLYRPTRLKVPISGKYKPKQDDLSPILVMMLSALFLALQVQHAPRLVIETEANEMYVSSLDGKTVTKIADGSRPVWSPDGSKIAFGVPNAGPESPVELFVIAADGTANRQIASNVLPAFDWKWTPDSKSLVYVKRIPNAFQQAWQTTIGGSSRKLGPVCLGEIDCATVSPRDQRLAVWQAVGPWTPTAEEDGKHRHELFIFGSAGAPRSVGQGISSTFSPDGKWLAFDRDSNLMIARADGTKPKKWSSMASGEEGFCSFHWLPDSSGIVFVNGARNLMFMRPDGTGKRRLTTKTDAAMLAPAGSKAMAFSDTGMILVDVQSGVTKRLYDDIDFIPIAWSGDGSRLYFINFNETGVTVRWHRSDGQVGGEYSAAGSTFDMDPLSPRGNVLVGIGQKGLTLYQADGTPVRILTDTRVLRYSWSQPSR